MVVGIIIGVIVAAIGISLAVGIVVVAKGCETLNERIEKGY